MSAAPPKVEDLVFEVVCARARQTFAPLPIASLRGLLGRCEVRPRDLKVLGPRPVEMLVGEGLQGGDGVRLGNIFAAAAIRRVASLPPRGREVFVVRLTELVAVMHERTAIRFPGDVRGILPRTVQDNAVTMGGNFAAPAEASGLDEAMEALLHNLPPIRPMRPPRRRQERAIGLPRGRRATATCRRFLRPPRPTALDRAPLVMLGLELPTIDVPPPVPREPSLTWEGASLPRLTRVRRMRSRTAQAILAADGRDATGARPGRWTRPAALAAGAFACLFGLPVALEGVLVRDPVWVALGTALAVGGLGLDAVLTVLGPRIFSPRKIV